MGSCQVVKDCVGLHGVGTIELVNFSYNQFDPGMVVDVFFVDHMSGILMLSYAIGV